MAFTWIIPLAISCLVSDSHAVDSLRFFVIGDMGGVDYEPYTTYYERSTAAEMGKVAEVFGPQYIFELGDNFYYDGVKGLDDIRFDRTFESVYTAKSLQVPWYLVAGNHDHRGNVTAQILYSNVSERWNYPSYYYYREFPIDSMGHKVGIVMMDTILLCGITHDDVHEQPTGPAHKGSAEKQWDFIMQTLANSKADYLFTAGHYPVFSVAEHGPTKCLEDRLQPMLEKYSVNGHMSGHDHNLQHLQIKSPKGTNLDYFVSGMANFIDPSRAHYEDVPTGSLKFHNADFITKGGFLYAETTVQNMTLTFVGANGKQLYKTVVSPRKL
ncbi:tartrate-resistant acid phosphatase type 5 [Aplysia californica]|uniref:Tartrate-resistant acid phosphatase type 5 n=1 Tax=Aplysia californica TaxID=6500 RepID=A0ABM0JKI7_APLCA|nr:tartrate-resistant acid phosphatase type 5 [Aplysia californica]